MKNSTILATSEKNRANIYILGKSLYGLLDNFVDWKPLMANNFS